MKTDKAKNHPPTHWPKHSKVPTVPKKEQHESTSGVEG